MITYETRSEFGNTRLYVIGGFEAYYALTGRKTLDDNQMRALRALGVRVEEED